MLAIDTNVIVRYLVGDHPAQAAKARKLVDNNDVFVCITVLLETEWVLRSVYDYQPKQVADALRSFAGLPRLTVQDGRSAATALDWMIQGIDFADALHLLQSGDTCEEFLSFDERLVKAADRLSPVPIRKL
jgi:predicted nucleic acid-binding protein